MPDWLDAHAHARRAREYLRVGRYGEALQHFTEATEARPEQGEWLFGMGLCLDALGRYAEAVRAFERVLAVRPEDAEALLLLAIDLLRVQQPRQALARLERFVELKPDSPDGYSYLILAHSALGEHEAAEQMFYMAVQLDENVAEPYDHIAHSLIELGERDRAIWCWQRTLQLDPKHPDARFSLAMAHWDNGDLRRARRLLERQLLVVPDDVLTMLNLGRLMLDTNCVSEAVDLFCRVLELEPENAEALARMGDIARLRGHLDAATSRYRHALAANPQLPGAHLGLALAAMAQGLQDEAAEHALAELDRLGQRPQQVLDLARLLIELDLPADALRLLTPIETELGLHTSIEQAAGLLYRGVALMMVGELREGIAECRMSFRLDPSSTAPLHNCILAYVQLGRLGRAHAIWRRLRQLEPSDPMCRSLGTLIRKARVARVRRRVSLELRLARRRVRMRLALAFGPRHS